MRNISEAASILGRKSAEVRVQKWGRREFVRRMRAWGKLGGRPRKITKAQIKKGRKA